MVSRQGKKTDGKIISGRERSLELELILKQVTKKLNGQEQNKSVNGKAQEI